MWIAKNSAFKKTKLSFLANTGSYIYLTRHMNIQNNKPYQPNIHDSIYCMLFKVMHQLKYT